MNLKINFLSVKRKLQLVALRLNPTVCLQNETLEICVYMATLQIQTQIYICVKDEVTIFSLMLLYLIRLRTWAFKIYSGLVIDPSKALSVRMKLKYMHFYFFLLWSLFNFIHPSSLSIRRAKPSPNTPYLKILA